MMFGAALQMPLSWGSYSQGGILDFRFIHTFQLLPEFIIIKRQSEISIDFHHQHPEIKYSFPRRRKGAM
jgi:hypothetical protein